jgi:hypothetical protein
VVGGVIKKRFDYGEVRKEERENFLLAISRKEKPKTKTKKKMFSPIKKINKIKRVVELTCVNVYCTLIADSLAH